MIRRKFQPAIILILSIVFMTIPAKAQQSTNAQLTGLVLDSSGASVPQASVKATNTATNVEYSTTSNDVGVYVLPPLVPGPYKVAASKEGFKTLVQSNLTLRIGDRLSLNLNLQPGEIQTTVDVTATAQVLTTDDATYSTTLDNAMITALPQLSRSTLDLTRVTPTVQGEGPAKIGGGGADFNVGIAGTAYALAGGQLNGTAITVDGAMAQDLEVNAVNRAIPSPDAVGEFRVQTGALTADIGRYSGGVITISSQSGTNDYHGRLFYYGRNQNLNANSWENNAFGIEKQPFHQNNYGLAVGGPLTIPKVYKGKDKTFFFFAWEGERFSTSHLIQSSVPTEDERRGDFSKSIIAYQEGQPVHARIFDMFNGSEDAQGNWIRPEFPGAVIPKDRQVALTPYYMNLWPLPNHAPDANTTGLNNFYALVKRTQPTDRQSFRLDHNFNERHRIQARVSRSRSKNVDPAAFLHTGRQYTYDNNWSGSFQYNWIISNKTVFEAHLGFGVSKLLNQLGSEGDPAINTDQWPFDPYVFANGVRSDPSIPPGLGGITYYTGVGGQFYDQFTNQLYNGSFSLSHIINRHTLKFGYQQFYGISIENGGDASGAVSVGPGGGSNQFWDNNDYLTGHPLAEIMLGSSSFYNWGNFLISPIGQAQSAFVMDDWKVNSKLTLQLGLRYDHENGRHARYRFPVIFDLNAKNVLTPNADWNWNQVLAAVPEAGQAPAWVSQGVNGRTALLNSPEYPSDKIFTTGRGILQPRFGISYSLDSKTVLHGSYGIVFQGFTGLQTEYGGSFYYGTPSFSQIPTLDGKHWVSEFGLDHGLGTFPQQADGSRLGYTLPLQDNAGFWRTTYGSCSNPIGICFSAPGRYNYPYEHVWGFSVQRELGSSWVASAEYQGIKGVNLITPLPDYRYTNLDPSYYSLGTKLNEYVPNPFFGQSQNFAAQPTVPLYQLLSSMPQYTSAGPGYLTDGRSVSQFVNFQLQSRNFHGLSLLASYNIRKTLVNNWGKDLRQRGQRPSLQVPNDLNERYSVALYEYPQNMLLNYYYELPFGRGKKWMGNLQGWGGRFANAVLGGWGFAGVTNWWAKGIPVLGPTVDTAVGAPGEAVRWSVNGSNYANSNVDYGKALVVQGAFVNPSPDRVFNSSAFVRTPDFSLGNIPIVFPNVRHPGGFTTDATMLKNFYFSENHQRYVNVRLEALNFFNHPLFGRVDNDPDSPTFGGILGKTGSPRVMQLGIRLFF